MRIHIYIILGLLPLVAAQSLAQNYTIESYLKEVENHNRNLKLANEDRRMAGTEESNALAGALPTVGMEAGYTANLTDYYMYLDMSALQPGADGVVKAPIRRNNEFSASVALQQTLFSPSVLYAIRASKQYRNLTDEAYEATRQAILHGAKVLFYQTLLLEDVLQVSQASQENAQENYKIMQMKYDNGQVSQLDLLLAETRWRNTIPETDQAERNHAIAMNTLKTMAGISLDTDVSLEGSLETVPVLPEVLEAEAVFEQRPDFRAMMFESQLRTTAVSAAKSSYYPTLSGTLAFAYSAQSDEFQLDEENKLLFAGVTLSWPIFTGGRRSAAVEAAEIELRKTELNIAQKKEETRNELANIRLRLYEAKNRIESADATLNAAKKAFEIAETTTRNGLTTQLELKDARQGFDQAQLGYYAAVFDYLQAVFDWEYNSGSMRAEK